MIRSRTANSIIFAIVAMASVAFSASPQAKTKAQSTAAKRAKLHRLLDAANDDNGDIHDSFLSLGTIGDSSSVPHLIRALRFYPDAEIGPDEHVGVICTQRHCVDALERITGAKVGISYSSWNAWWQSTHPNQPLVNPSR
jgi:hypothetical protein